MKVQEAVRRRITELMDQKQLSMNKVAENCYMTTSTLQNILNGNTKSSEITTITKICYGLGVTLNEFIDSALFKDVNYLEE